MIRTQVYLPKDLYQELDLLAKEEGKAKAGVIRELLTLGVQKKKIKTAGKALMALAKLGDKLNLKGPTDLSVNHNKYYEEL